jgi:hypothetical protein
MTFLKPLVKTVFLSSILFFALVYLGMKYHWIGFNPNDNDKKLELKIPKHSQTLASNTANHSLLSSEGSEDESEKGYQPQIIQTSRSSSLVINMTKAQVIESCTQLLRKKMADTNMLELAVGDCVISNYRDPIIETSLEWGAMRSTSNRQVQLRRNNILKICKQSISSANTAKFSNEIEKQLLLGICISGKLK